MDALSRFWCELQRLRAKLNDAADDDSAALDFVLDGQRPKFVADFDLERAAWAKEWSLEGNSHIARMGDIEPPPGRVRQLLAAEGYKEQRLSKLEDLAARAIDEKPDPGRAEVIRRASIAMRMLARHLFETDCYADSDLAWSDVDQELTLAIDNLGFYVPQPHREYDGSSGQLESTAEVPQSIERTGRDGEIVELPKQALADCLGITGEALRLHIRGKGGKVVKLHGPHNPRAKRVRLDILQFDAPTQAKIRAKAGLDT